MKRIVFSTTFPSYHPRKREKTFFIEKIWKGLLPVFGEEVMREWLAPHDGIHWDIENIIRSDVRLTRFPKLHTLRPERVIRPFQLGDEFLPVIWSGRPYHSPQIQFAPALKVKFLAETVIHKNLEKYGFPYVVMEGHRFLLDMDEVAKNDGLEMGDFQDWFPKEKSTLQLISWHNNPYQS